MSCSVLRERYWEPTAIVDGVALEHKPREIFRLLCKTCGWRSETIYSSREADRQAAAHIGVPLDDLDISDA